MRINEGAAKDQSIFWESDNGGGMLGVVLAS